MAVNSTGLALIKHFEGLRLKAYKDPVGIWTIGYGHTGSDVYPGKVITAEEAEDLLEGDLAKHESYVSDAVKVPLNSNQFSALVSFAFNVGNGNLQASTLLKKLNKEDYAGAADELLRWVYGTVNGKKVQLPGLVRRREQERNLFLGKKVVLGMDVITVGAPADKTVPSLVADDYEGDFASFIQGLGLRYFQPFEFLVLGNQNANPQSPAFGLNKYPPRNLWSNIARTAKVLDKLRELLGAPIVTQSVYRTPAYNKKIGGAKASQHMDFNAIDFIAKGNSSPSEWAAVLRQMRQAGVFKGGIGTYATFVHVDTRGKNADW